MIDTHWLYLYYSDVDLKVIAIKLKLRQTKSISKRIRYMKMPARPLNFFNKKVRMIWLKEPHVKALRRLFKGMEK